MKMKVNFEDFKNKFTSRDRIINFSNNGLVLLYDFLKDYEEETGEELELDVVGLCCEFTEYTVNELIDEYYEYVGDDEEETEEFEKLNQVLKYLSQNTHVIYNMSKDCYIVQEF